MNVLVTGADGFLGAETIRQALAMGHEPRALTRAAERPGRGWSLPKDRVFVRDLAAPGDLSRVMEGVDGVIHCAAVTSAKGASADLSWRVNVEGTRLLLAAARRAGVKRWIQISTMSAHPGSTSVYGKTKLAADVLLRRDYPDPPPAWTILRPSLIYGPGSRGLASKTLSLARRLPFLPMIGHGQERMRPVLARDVAIGALRCLELEQVKGQTYMIGGADEVTVETFMRRLTEAAGLRRPILKLPTFACIILARIFALCFKEPPITVDNVLGMKEVLRTDHARAVREWEWTSAGIEEGLAFLRESPER